LRPVRRGGGIRTQQVWGCSGRKIHLP
jgi:hypothetical protein